MVDKRYQIGSNTYVSNWYQTSLDAEFYRHSVLSPVCGFSNRICFICPAECINLFFVTERLFGNIRIDVVQLC